jgi:hypothetical protein
MKSRLLTVALLVATARAAEIKGTVVNARGEPLGRVQVSVMRTHMRATTSDDGAFTLAGISPGNYALRLDAVGYRFVSIPFSIGNDAESKEFSVSLVPDNFQRTETVEVRSDVFHGSDIAAVGEVNLIGTEVKQAGTVLADDPFRAVQTLPGVSPSGNNDFFAQFSIFGAPFNKIAVYLDDVLVQQPFHGIPNEPEGASLSVLNGETVDELKLMPAVFPARYGDATGAALAIHTREGSRSKQTFRISSGLAYSNFTGEGALGHTNRGSWLMTARKSYLGYLVRRSVGDDVADVSFADGSGKLVYDVTKRQRAELYVIGGHADLSHAAPLSSNNPNDLESGGNDFTLARAGWRFAATPDLMITTHAAYIRQRYDTENPFHNKLRADYYGEWLGGAEALWNWSKQQQSEAGWTLRRLRDNRYAIFYSGNEGALASSNDGAALRESGYMQHAASLLGDRIRLSGGLRWDHLEGVATTFTSPQAAVSLRGASSTELQFGFGRYAQFPDIAAVLPPCGRVAPFIERSDHYTAALEQRIGDRSRFRVEAFDREDRDLLGERTFDFIFECTALHRSRLISTSFVRDHSRGVQFMLQRRSANRLSGWIGYTFAHARQRFGSQPIYSATPDDQRHTINAFASYRLRPSLSFSGKWLYGSGFPVVSNFQIIGNSFFPIGNPVRLGPYERLDLRADKSFAYTHWKFTLYGEVLNVTNHDNRRFFSGAIDPRSGQAFLETGRGLPVVPTAGVTFEF